MIKCRYSNHVLPFPQETIQFSYQNQIYALDSFIKKNWNFLVEGYQWKITRVKVVGIPGEVCQNFEEKG